MTAAHKRIEKLLETSSLTREEVLFLSKMIELSGGVNEAIVEMERYSYSGKDDPSVIVEGFSLYYHFEVSSSIIKKLKLSIII